MSVHNFKNTSVIVGGNIMTGFFDGSAIAGEANEDKWSQHVGADGGVTYNESNNDTGTLTLQFKPDSPSVPILNALYKSGESFDFLVQDTLLNQQITGENCRIQKLPSFSRAEEVEGREFIILAAYYKES